MEEIKSLLTSVVRPYSFIVTDGKGVEYRRNIHVAQHTAAASSANRRKFYILHFLNKKIVLQYCDNYLQYKFYIYLYPYFFS